MSRRSCRDTHAILLLWSIIEYQLTVQAHSSVEHGKANEAALLQDAALQLHIRDPQAPVP